MLRQWLARCADRGEAMLAAPVQFGLSMTAIAAALGLSVSRVGRLIKRAEAERAHQLRV